MRRCDSMSRCGHQCLGGDKSSARGFKGWGGTAASQRHSKSTRLTALAPQTRQHNQSHVAISEQTSWKKLIVFFDLFHLDWTGLAI